MHNTSDIIMSVESNVVIQRNVHWLRTWTCNRREGDSHFIWLNIYPCAHPQFTELPLTSKGRGGSSHQAYDVCAHAVVLQVGSMCFYKAHLFYLHTWRESKVLFYLHIFLVSWNCQLQRRSVQILTICLSANISCWTYKLATVFHTPGVTGNALAELCVLKH